MAPAVLLLKRPVRNKLPQTNYVDPVSEIVHERDFSQKSKFKAHADSKVYVKPSTISPGETVLVKRPFTASKGATVYDPTPLTVVDKKGSMITALSLKLWTSQSSTVMMIRPMTVVSALQLTSNTNKSCLMYAHVLMLLTRLHQNL